MDEYHIVKEIGKGSFGVVLLAVHKESGKEVAIKKLNQEYSDWKECSSLPEVETLTRIVHPNIVRLLGIVKSKNHAHLIFERMESNLYELIQRKCSQQTTFLDSHIRNYMFQILDGVCCMHQLGYIHRDLKPENILISDYDAKIADFGLCIALSDPKLMSGSSYIATRWYRAPELLLKQSYQYPVDIWAVGCVMAELYLLQPLFPAKNEVEQLNLVSNMQLNQETPCTALTTLQAVSPPIAVDLITKLLAWSPENRISAKEAMLHPYFDYQT